MEEHTFFRFVLLADEFERPIQRLDRRFERPFDITAPQPQFVDVPLDFLESPARLLQQQIARPCASRTIILPSFSPPP